jgi:hypothetical protein
MKSLARLIDVLGFASLIRFLLPSKSSLNENSHGALRAYGSPGLFRKLCLFDMYLFSELAGIARTWAL